MPRPHLACWDGKEETYQHICQVPTGQTCIEDGCENPAGTWWTHLWCPDCDVVRLNRITAQFQKLADGFRDMGKRRETA